jgi:DNA repair exonuclease SbcCD ATPase subunit
MLASKITPYKLVDSQVTPSTAPLQRAHALTRCQRCSVTAPRAYQENGNGKQAEPSLELQLKKEDATLPEPPERVMVVAEDLHSGASARRERLCIAVPPRPPTPQDALAGFLGWAVGYADALVPRQEMLSRELRDTRKRLAQRDIEVNQLRRQLRRQVADRDVRLRASRAELLESRAALRDLDDQLALAAKQAAEVGVERARLRAELVETHAELASTRAELEQLADEVLAITNTMEDEDGFAAVAGDHEAEGQLHATIPASTATKPENQSGGAVPADVAMVQALAQLSREMLGDADDDESAFSQVFKSLRVYGGAGRGR